jgi:hypothetical protein
VCGVTDIKEKDGDAYMDGRGGGEPMGTKLLTEWDCKTGAGDTRMDEVVVFDDSWRR